MAAAERSATPDQPDPLATARLEMASGETLLWAETSLPGHARRRIFPLSLVGWLFLALSLAWMSRAAGTSIWLLIMGLPSVAISLGFAALPWWWPALSKRTVYAISDRRLLIIRDLMKRRVTSYGPDDIDVVERRERRDGSGDVIFRREEFRKLRHHSDRASKRRTGEREIGFFGVPHARRVEEAILALKQQRNRDSAIGEGRPKVLSQSDQTP